MEQVGSASTQSAPIPNTSTPHISLVKSMAYQCLSPITAELPEELIKRTRDMESEQKRLIAQLDQTFTDNNKFRSADSGVSEQSTSVSSSLPHISQGQRNPLTPPSSTTSTPHKSDHFPFNSPTQTIFGHFGVSRSRSFGGRRSRKPRELDLDALRRERQFSGPYSANPLLPRKRRTQSAELMPDRDEVETPKRLRPPLELEPLEPEPNSSSWTIRLPLISHMTTAPYVANGNGRAHDVIWPPLCSSSPRSLPSSAHQLSTLLPRRSTSVQVSPSSNAFSGEVYSSSQTAASQSDGNVDGQQDCVSSKNKQTLNGNKQPEDNFRSSSQNTESLQTSIENDRKARYMQLCSEMWDLLHN